MKKVPQWVVDFLGQEVCLSKPHSDGLREYPAGSRGTLVSIQAGAKRAFATVTLHADPLSAEDNFQFHDIRPG